LLKTSLFLERCRFLDVLATPSQVASAILGKGEQRRGDGSRGGLERDEGAALRFLEKQRGDKIGNFNVSAEQAHRPRQVVSELFHPLLGMYFVPPIAR
jgi:hypothetical protein